MSEPSPKQPDPPRPAAQGMVQSLNQEGNTSVGNGLRAVPPGPERHGVRSLQNPPAGSLPAFEPCAAQQPAAKSEAAQPKSSLVISKSYRVRELPPPRSSRRPGRTMRRLPMPASRHVARRPCGRRGKAAGTADRTRCLADPTPGRGNFLRRRVRMPPRWEQWLADPQRRNSVGVGASIVINVALVCCWRSFCGRRREHRPPSRSMPGCAAGWRGDGSARQERAVPCANPWCGRSPQGAGDRGPGAACGSEI